jgi:hypothetical protein
LVFSSSKLELDSDSEESERRGDGWNVGCPPCPETGRWHCGEAELGPMQQRLHARDPGYAAEHGLGRGRHRCSPLSRSLSHDPSPLQRSAGHSHPPCAPPCLASDEAPSATVDTLGRLETRRTVRSCEATNTGLQEHRRLGGMCSLLSFPCLTSHL